MFVQYKLLDKCTRTLLNVLNVTLCHGVFALLYPRTLVLELCFEEPLSSAEVASLV
jgi:hypothetical protein